jgi:hypothetical protein
MNIKVVCLSFTNRKKKEKFWNIEEADWVRVIEDDPEMMWHYLSPEVENPGRVSRYTQKYALAVWYPNGHESRWSNIHIYYSRETGGIGADLLKADKKHIKKVVEIAEKLDCDVIRGRKKINDKYR